MSKSLELNLLEGISSESIKSGSLILSSEMIGNATAKSESNDNYSDLFFDCLDYIYKYTQTSTNL